MHKKASGFVFAVLVIASGSVQAQSLSVSYRDNLITVRCDDATLGQVFEEIRSATGLELFLEDPVKGKRLTADIDAQPLNFAVERLLAGAGVNYAMMYDPENWQRVSKLFIGEGGGALAPSPAGGGRATRRVQPIEDAYDPSEEYEDGYPEDQFEEDYIEDETGFDEAAEFDDGFVEEEPPGQDYLPPPPSFPRSRFTPGLEASPFGANQQQSDETDSGSTSRPRRPTRPPAYYPFTDQFGRPIPVPPDVNDPNAQPGAEFPEEFPEDVPEDEQ